MSSAALLTSKAGWSEDSQQHERQKCHHSQPVYPLELLDLSASDISRLTAVLSNAPRPSLPDTALTVETYRKGTKALIQALPDRLRAPVLGQAKLVGWLNKCGAGCPSAVKLCKLHKRLNAQLMADILDCVKNEIEGQLPRILRLLPATWTDLEKTATLAWQPYKEANNYVTPEEEARKCLLALQSVHGMYIPAVTFRSQYARDPPARCAYQTDDCAACILARIGTDAEALVGLRAVFLGRGWSDAKVRKSKRLLWVESWIMGFGAEAARDMLERSERVGEMMQRLRRERKRGEMRLGGQRTGKEMEGEDGEAWRPCSSVYSARCHDSAFVNPFANTLPCHREEPPSLSTHQAHSKPRPSSSIYSRATYDFKAPVVSSSTYRLPPQRFTTTSALKPVPETASINLSSIRNALRNSSNPISPTEYSNSTPSLSSTPTIISQRQPHQSAPQDASPFPIAVEPAEQIFHDRDCAASVYAAHLAEHDDLLDYYLNAHTSCQSHIFHCSPLAHHGPSPPIATDRLNIEQDSLQSAVQDRETDADSGIDVVPPGKESSNEAETKASGRPSRRDTQWQRFMDQRWERWSDEDEEL